MMHTGSQRPSDFVAHSYSGELVCSNRKQPSLIQVEVRPLRDQIVRVQFTLEERSLSFRAVLTVDGDDVLMTIQDKVTHDYILTGVEGFSRKHPRVHGGVIRQLKGFYFHIILNHFNGIIEEQYFFGKRVGHSQLADQVTE